MSDSALLLIKLFETTQLLWEGFVHVYERIEKKYRVYCTILSCYSYQDPQQPVFPFILLNSYGCP